ncbi:MAG: hypothetical protein AB7O56_00125 [Bauldia sp.]
MGGRNGVARRVALLAAGVAILGGSVASGAMAADILPPVVASPIVVVPEHMPRFYANLNVLLMSRGQADPQTILRFGGITVLSTNEVAFGMDAADFHFGWSFGLQGRAGVFVKNGLALEAGAFWIRPLVATVDMFGGGAAYSLSTDPDFAEIGLGPLDGALGYDRTGLHGFEANAVATLDHGFTVYGGATYIRLRDELAIEVLRDFEDENERFTWTADNRMIGPQVGLRFAHEAQRATFGFDVRAAYLFNSVFASFVSGPADGGIDVEDTDDAKTRTLMLAAGVNTGFRLSNALVLTLGYQIMSFNNVATGFAQILGTVPEFFPNDAELTATFGPLVVHGLTAGVTLTY